MKTIRNFLPGEAVTEIGHDEDPGMFQTYRGLFGLLLGVLACLAFVVGAVWSW